MNIKKDHERFCMEQGFENCQNCVTCLKRNGKQGWSD